MYDNDPKNQEFVTRLEEVCTKYADKAAVTYLRNDSSKIDFTFKDIFERVQAAKNRFTRAGLQPGDRAAIISPLSPFSVFALFSLAYANITAVLIDATLPTEEIDRLIAFSIFVLCSLLPRYMKQWINRYMKAFLSLTCQERVQIIKYSPIRLKT